MVFVATFQVRIRRATAGELWIQVTSKTTILDIKRKIFEDGAIPPYSQRFALYQRSHTKIKSDYFHRLIWDGEVLDNDNATLESYGITTEVDIYMESI
ncbi:Ubiquitin-like Rad60 SUMO-like protein [Ceratobasidium theobromae]|uniref:Ubiquitin-like Rad60 SUMO-like protein n=1 Tax=Ceratobasidium theobromae TaxID=1582974 RepID=A0A5N5QV15_9AGAM|nr:Ubiquitin-like Rad60 SUMO-like protein [Ceratobasidium theobromae]